MKNMNYLRRGFGTPLLLVHGLGGSSQSWNPILNSLADERDVIAVDLPGFGETPALQGETSIATLADALTEFLAKNNLLGIDAVGSSMGARLVLELARRGEILGSVIALNPGGFWQGVERHAFYASIFASIRMIRKLQPVLPKIVKSRTARAALIAQFSYHPTKISAETVLTELQSFANSESFDEALQQLAYGEEQQGAAFGSIRPPLVIAWGKQDRVCFPKEAKRALQLFPDAKIRWFDNCGHFPHWDAPRETIDLILTNTGQQMLARRLRDDLFQRDIVSPTASGDELKTAERARSERPDSPAL